MLPIKKSIIRPGDVIRYRTKDGIKEGKVVQLLPRGTILDNYDVVLKREMIRWTRGKK